MSRIGRSRAAVYYLLEGPAPPPPIPPDSWPFPACPLQGQTPFADASFWFWGEGGHDEAEVDGFFFAPTIIIIRRPGQASAADFNHSSGVGFKQAASNIFASDMPHDCVVKCVFINSGGTDRAQSGWGYIGFENIPYWQTHPLQIDWLAFTGGLFDPALAGGVEVWCCDPLGEHGEMAASLADIYFPAGVTAPLPVPWVVHSGFPALTEVTGKAQPSVFSALNVSLVNESLGADQWATVQVGTVSAHLATSFLEMGLVLRASASVQTWYHCRYAVDGAGNELWAIDKHVAGVVTNLAIINHVGYDQSAQSGDVLGAEVIGTTIKLLRNGVVLLTATDASIASGKIGMTAHTAWIAASTIVYNGFTGGNGPCLRRDYDGYDARIADWGRQSTSDPTAAEGPQAIITGDPVWLPQLHDLLYTLTTPSDLPITIPVPAGRALMFRTVNQLPNTMPLGNTIFGDINVGFLNPDPAGAYKNLKSEDPGAAAGIWTVTAASQLRLKSLVHEVTVGGAFDHRHTVLVYRDPARLVGNTLRINVTAPFLWYTEDPALTYFGGGMEVTLTAYAVDESELTGTPQENWQNVIKGWGYAAVEARVGAVLASAAYVTATQDTFFSGAGNLDVDLTGGRRLVYYKFSAVATPTNPNGGLHLPAILHSNPSIF